jgi:integrase
LRIGEMLALRWAAVDTISRRITVSATLTDLAGTISFGPPKTKAAVRTVTVPSFVIAELTSTKTVRRTGGTLVFQSPEGHVVRPGLLRRRFWDPAVHLAELSPLRIHDLRHTAVALWIAAGANPKQIATRAGHTSVSVVLDRYGHLLPLHDDPLINALDASAPAGRSIATVSGAHRMSRLMLTESRAD